MSIPTASSIAITNATAATPIVITTATPHGRSAGDHVSIGGVRGTSEANGDWTVSLVVDANNFALSGSVGTNAYTGGGGVWPRGAILTQAEITAFDVNLATRAVDKTGDVASGVYTFSKGSDPTIELTDATSRITVNANGAVVQTASTGRYMLSNNDHTTLDPPRTRTILLSPVEAFVEYLAANPQSPVCFAANLGGVASTQNATKQALWFPLTRLHDGAKLAKVMVYFFPQLQDLNSAVLPTAFPTAQVYRFDPTADTVPTALATAGPAIFASPATSALYAQTPSVGASGNVTVGVTVPGTSATIAAGAILNDSFGNRYQITTGGSYADGASVPVVAIAPDPPAAFYGAQTNRNSGEVLTWATTPSGARSTVTVSAAGLTGGLDAGYAQSLVYVPDSDKATIDQSTYCYVLKLTDDNAVQSSSLGWYATVYTGIRLDFENITSLAPQ